MSQSAMELLRLETELDFWPILLNGHHHHHHNHNHRHPVTSSNCPHAPPSPPSTSTVTNVTNTTTNNATTNAVTHHHHHHSHGGGDGDKSQKDKKKSVAGYSRTPHSYYECCINVHVSALLDHWLDWDRSPAVVEPVPTTPLVIVEPTTTTTNIDELISHLASLADPLPTVRQYCTNLGCDVINRKDKDGKTVFHHLLAGKVRTSLPDMCKVLLEFGADVEAKDNDGNTPLLQLGSLLENGLFPESEAIAKILITDHGCDVNAINSRDRTILSYSVTYGDRSIALTRLLLNSGAKVWPDVTVASQCNTIDVLAREKDLSAFTWFLRSLMRRENVTLEDADETLYLLCTIMGEQPSRMRQHVHRTMMQLGKSRSLNGPLFRKIHSIMIPYWARPQDLRYICLKSIRKSLGPKRLSSGGATSKLSLPKKLQHYVELREVPAKLELTSSSSVAVTIPAASFSSQQQLRLEGDPLNS